MRQRLGLLAATAVVGLVLVSVALATTFIYAGPKTWLASWDAGGSYDGSPIYWRVNSMGPKSDDACYPSCSSRVVFIDTGGGWTYSYTDANSWTVRGIPEGSQFYTKKPYCKNNSSASYTAECDVSN